MEALDHFPARACTCRRVQAAGESQPLPDLRRPMPAFLFKLETDDGTPAALPSLTPPYELAGWRHDQPGEPNMLVVKDAHG